MAVAKDDAKRDGGNADRGTTELLLEDHGEGITKEKLIEALEGLPDGTLVSLCIGPDYADVPMTDAVFWPSHGAVFLLGDVKDDDDDDETPPIEGQWTEVPRCEPEEEFVDEAAAEPA